MQGLKAWGAYTDERYKAYMIKAGATASATPIITEKDIAAVLNPNLKAADNSASNIMIAVAASVLLFGVIIARR